MILYLDTSALLKAVVAEPETGALREALLRAGREERTLVGSQLTSSEFVRACRRLGLAPRAYEPALDAVEVIDLVRDDYADAARLEPASLRTLDALHVAVARRIGAEALLTYDARQIAAAAAAGIAVLSPA